MIASFIPVKIPSLKIMEKIRPAKPPSVEHLLDEDFQGAIGGLQFYCELPVATEAGLSPTRRFRVRRMTFLGEEDPATGSAACALSVWMSGKANSSDPRGRRDFMYEIEQGVEMGRVSCCRCHVHTPCDLTICVEE